MKKGKINIKYPIVIKLILIISIIVLVSSTIVTVIASWQFSKESRGNAEYNNFETSELQTAHVENYITTIVSNIYLLFDTFRNIQGNRVLEKATVNNFWIRNATIAAVILPNEKRIYNMPFFRANELEPDIIPPLLKRYKEELSQAKSGVSFCFNASPVFGLPVMGLMIPYKEFGTNNALIIFFSTEQLQSRMQTDKIYSVFAVNSTGDIILHEDYENLSLGANIKSHPVVKDMFSSPTDNKQIRFKDKNGEYFLGAYRKISRGGLGVITTMPVSKVMEVVKTTFIRNLILSGIVLLFSILGVYFFSKSISKPIKALVLAALKIESGDYEPDIKPTSNDELGTLTESFIQMSRGLAEREHIKNTFGKFVNKTIAEQALKGDLTLGGEEKNATILFSDIRSFTEISEALTPEQVVEFLNDYMSRMVSCINKSHGVVDKFIGDAIMALWGVPISDGSIENDALNSIRAALKMRLALIAFNKNRGGQDKPVIKIGCGINTGATIAGQIGSEQRMEYTVIGDAVNLASRIEALNKPFGTDILISENTYLLLKDKVIVKPMSMIKVKGKAEPLQIYAVINLKNSDGPKTLTQVRKLVGIEVPDKKPDVDKAEVKYEILDRRKDDSR